MFSLRLSYVERLGRSRLDYIREAEHMTRKSHDVDQEANNQQPTNQLLYPQPHGRAFYQVIWLPEAVPSETSVKFAPVKVVVEVSWAVKRQDGNPISAFDWAVAVAGDILPELLPCGYSQSAYRRHSSNRDSCHAYYCAFRGNTTTRHDQHYHEREKIGI